MSNIKCSQPVKLEPGITAGWRSLGDLAATVAKRSILLGYAHGRISLDRTQALIDELKINEA